MGANAIAAANATFSQLRTLYPGRTDTRLRAMLGIAPMLGPNDVAPEVFTLSHARQALDFARQNQVGRPAFWLMARPELPRWRATVAVTCRGSTRQPFDFT
ncbi:MAG TPA: hypothetical protein DCQ84_07065 [Candidatus Competibacteraceae bacterium]|nr:hypothetical protein [Candidatus Competibacteraceae bacterium]HAO32695.1 hypothetical protein [Candidatus Competibacteraceae bacterium]